MLSTRLQPPTARSGKVKSPAGKSGQTLFLVRAERFVDSLKARDVGKSREP